MAFSGATPKSCGTNPLYNPNIPSCRMTFLKQSKLFLYINSPINEPVRWFCIRVFTKSIGYTAVAPTAENMKYVHKFPFKSSKFKQTNANPACMMDHNPLETNIYWKWVYGLCARMNLHTYHALCVNIKLLIYKLKKTTQKMMKVSAI